MAKRYDLLLPGGNGASIDEITPEIAEGMRDGMGAAGADDLDSAVGAESIARAAANLPGEHPRLDAGSDAMAALPEMIQGLSPGSSLALFATQVHAPPSYARNTDCWAESVDMTCLGVWNSQYGAGMIGFTAITARHVLMCHHAPIANGSTLRWVTRDNVIIERVLSASVQVPSTDLRVGLLSAALPNTITPARLLPANWGDYMTILTGQPVVYTNQQNQAAIGSLDSERHLAAFTGAESWFASVQEGDSGHAWGMIMGGQFVMISQFFNSVSGNWITDSLAAIMTAIDGLGQSLPLTPAPLRHTVDWPALRNLPLGSAAYLDASETPGPGDLVIVRSDGTIDADLVAGIVVDLNFFETVSVGSGATVGSVIRAKLPVGSTSSWVALSPVGAAGYLCATSTASGTANARGAGAVDWQQVRGDATQVASTAASTISGGRNNKVNLTAFSGAAFVATAAWIPGGDGATVRNPGSYAWAAGSISVAGDLQTTGHLLGARTTSATPAVLGRLGQMDIAQEIATVTTYRGTLTAVSSTSLVKTWDISVTVRTAFSAGSTVMLGKTITSAYQSAGAEAWAADMAANGFALRTTVTGAAGVNINWGMRLEAVEVAQS